MDKDAAAVFFGMALTISMTRVIGMPSLSLVTVWMFGYFCMRRFTYFLVESRFNTQGTSIFRTDSADGQMIATGLGATTLLLWVVAGYYVGDGTMVTFLGLLALMLVTNVAWIVTLIELIDDDKDRATNTGLLAKKMLKGFLWIHTFELVVCAVAALWLRGQVGLPGTPFEVLAPYIVHGALGVLSFLLLIDYVRSRKFVFPPS